MEEYRKGIFMNNNLLHTLQKEIINKTGIYLLFNFVLIIFLLVNVEEIKIFLSVFRIILSSIALITLLLIYFKCKKTRTLKENSIINKNIIFYLLLNFGSIYTYKRHKYYSIYNALIYLH